MKSSSFCKLTDLENDLPTSREDILALRRSREPRLPSFAAYLDFLANFTPPPTAELRARRGPAGGKPFEL
jgi:hypothetical protein